MPTEYELERILQLPLAPSVDGSEYAVVVQGGVTKRTLVSNIGVGGGGSSAYELEITGDDNPANDIRTVTHGLDTDTPSGQLWYEYEVGKWRPLDWTQGITSDSSTPNEVQVNLLAYEGNTPANKYKIIVIGTVVPSNGITRTVQTTASNVTAGNANLTDYVYFLTGANTLTLPTAVGNTNRYLIIRKSASVVSIASTSGQTFNGVAGPINLNVDKTQIEFISDGSNWTY